MERFKAFLRWVEANEDLYVDLIRIYLGIGLFVRGIVFLSDSSFLTQQLMIEGEPALSDLALLHYIALAHLAGGLFLAMGLLTRVAALIQIPILLGAVFLVHWGEGLGSADQSFEFAMLVLFLLVLFLIRGSGRFSVEAYLAREQARRIEREYKGTRQSIPRDRPAVKPATTPEAGPLARRKPAATAAPVCSCGHTKDHELVEPQLQYGTFGKVTLLLGARLRPVRIDYRCRRCGEVIEQTADPELLNVER